MGRAHVCQDTGDGGRGAHVDEEEAEVANTVQLAVASDHETGDSDEVLNGEPERALAGLVSEPGEEEAACSLGGYGISLGNTWEVVVRKTYRSNVGRGGEEERLHERESH